MTIYDFMGWTWVMAGFGAVLGIILSGLKDWWLKGL